MKLVKFALVALMVAGSVDALAAKGRKVETKRDKGAKEQKEGPRETGAKARSQREAKSTKDQTASDFVTKLTNKSLTRTQIRHLGALVVARPALAELASALESARNSSKLDITIENPASKQSVQAKDTLAELEADIVSLLSKIAKTNSNDLVTRVESADKALTFLETQAKEMIQETSEGNMGYLEAGILTSFVKSVNSNVKTGLDVDAAINATLALKAFKDKKSKFEELCKL